MQDMDLLPLLAALKEYFVGWGVILTILTVFEVLNPREDHSLRSRLAGIMFWAVSIAFSLILVKTFGMGWRMIGVEPLITVPSMERWFGYPLAAAAAAGVLVAVTHDFFFYWYHRAQHRWFWRWHAVHHSVRNLNAVNSYHHISEALFSLILIKIPMTLLISDIGPTLPIVTVVLWCHILWIHSPTRITLGPLRSVLVDNRFHRIHHSLEQQHFDKNFGAFTTLWDRAFGTCHMPAKDEWPAVGLAEAAEPRGLVDWFEIPGRLKRGESAGSPPCKHGDTALASD